MMNPARTLEDAVIARNILARQKVGGSLGTPLYGHKDEHTAYLVEDYPYGFSARCRIRY